MTDEKGKPDLSGATWLASYPKSGNTWLRCLLEAYRCNGYLDINDLRLATSDGGMTIMQGVSPVPLGPLELGGELLLRPAAILNLMARLRAPCYIKTHFANVTLPNLPACIPAEFTRKAVYVVRDPRSILMSFSKYFGLPLEAAVETMNNKDFTIGGTAIFSRVLISSWWNHVASWTSEEKFPVHLVRYEDLLENPEKELKEIIEFLEWEVDEKRVKLAIAAASSENLQKQEEEEGFRENKISANGNFFNGGGSRWRDEVGLKWIKQIEEDQGEIMKLMEYEV